MNKLNIINFMQIFVILSYLFFSLWDQNLFHYKIWFFYYLYSIFKFHFCGKSKFAAWHINLGYCHNILSLESISHQEVIAWDWGVPYELSWWHIVINIVFFVKSKLRLHGMWIKWNNSIINWKCLKFKWPWLINGLYVW